MENNIGLRIKQLRDHYEMNIRDFAFKCGVSYAIISCYETGKRKKVNVATLYKIIEIFGTTKEWLLDGVGEMLPNGIRHVVATEFEIHKFWQDEVFIQQEEKILILENEIERLWKLLDNLTNINSSNYRINTIKEN